MSTVINSLPSADGFSMPGEFASHHGCLMIWPVRPGSWPYGGAEAQGAFIQVARAIADSEEVWMLAGPEHLAQAQADEESGSAETEDTEEEITAYARVGDSQIVYQLSGSDYEALMAASYDELRHQEVLWADFAGVTQLDITLEGEEYTISAEGEGDDRTWTYQGEELEIDDLQSALEGLTAAEFTDEAPDQQEEISLTVHLDSERFPTVEIQLYRYDGTNCLAVVDGESVSLVPREQVVDLTQQLLETGFSPRSALKLVNTVLLLSGAQHPATLDLSCVDLHTAVLEVMKLGAVPTFIIGQEGVERLEAGQVPAGVLRDAEPVLISRKLWEGDRIVMVTDGVLDALPGDDKAESMRQFLEGMEETGPQELAEKILDFAISCIPMPRDDMTVLTAGIWKKAK